MTNSTACLPGEDAGAGAIAPVNEDGARLHAHDLAQSAHKVSPHTPVVEQQDDVSDGNAEVGVRLHVQHDMSLGLAQPAAAEDLASANPGSRGNAPGCHTH